MSARVIPDSVRAPQGVASDPSISAWVSANAGSGKTHVLTQRVIRLLLQGVEPAKILCITFTKAAAANMATRVFDTLAAWTALDDDALDKRIREAGATPDDLLRQRARQLFALALETPGGLKVQTIHAFCTRLLHQFPFEADVAARFTVLDAIQEQQLLDELSLAALLEGAGKPDSPLGRALAIAMAAGADSTFREIVAEAIGAREAIFAWLGADGVEKAISRLSRTLDLAPDDTAEGIAAAYFSGSLIPATEWPAIAGILGTGSTNDRGQGARFAALSQSAGEERIQHYLSIFCTGELKPRASLVTNGIATAHPALADRLQREQTRVCALLEKQRAVVCRDRSAALLTVAEAVLRRYAAAKRERGLLDYDDLIEKTQALFRDTSAAWVHYKLDLGIDHVLIDEAQDTSPAQWEIISRLVGEFTAGAGARSVKRTIFAVGDDKQSIFSFQGARPEKFDAMRRKFQRDFEAAKLAWKPVKLETSFRSGIAILDAVDEVFRREDAYRGLSADRVNTVHRALPDALPGHVEIWQPVQPEERPAIEGWDAPFDTERETSPRVMLAQNIARHVKSLLDRGEPVGHGDKRHPARPGDILILVRQRGPLFEAIIRALKEKRVPVAGADRLVLTEHIAVMDLIALADALLLPQDDLAVATILKSPLFGLTEDELFQICWDRKTNVWPTLKDKASGNPRFARAAGLLERCAEAAREKSPFGFYAWLLGPAQGRKRILARLGHEAADALDEFLNFALDYESRETPSLQGFVDWLRRANAEVKRDMEHGRNEVRVMTVHGAKGLEAPIVVLADTMTKPEGSHPPRLLHLHDAEAAHLPPCIVWAVAKKHDVPALSTAREAALRAERDEYCRLLYVAMTRAADRLIVCGADGAKARPEGCWFDLVFDALSPHCLEAAGPGESKVWLYPKDKATAPAAATASPQIVSPEPALPPWLLRAAPPADLSALPITPSGALEDDENFPVFSGEGAEIALRRGRAVHRLMQSLPDIPPQRRRDAAAHYLARHSGDIPAGEHPRILKDVFGILDDPRFGALFAAGSRPEIPVVGRLARDGRPSLAVSGQIDRLVVTPQAVLIADYKTNSPAPRRIEDAPRAYLRQLALYRALLSRTYPDRPVRAALVWTDTLELMEVPAAALDAAMAKINAP